VSIAFSAIFFERFAHIFNDRIKEERSMRTLFEKQANQDELTQVLSRRGIFKAIKGNSALDYFGIILLDTFSQR
jgi:hypothetical protein